LPSVEAIPLTDHGYDFEARYTPGATEFVTPAEGCGEAAAIAVRACELLGCADFARVDLIVPRTGRPRSSRPTSCRLTETSLAPLAAQAAGMTFEELVARLVEAAVGARVP
jgi:D-alanine-D-alanine ligase